MKFTEAAAALVAAYQRAPGAEPESFARTEAYRRFAEAAEQAGFTGPDMEMDQDFAGHSSAWVGSASEEALKRYVHTMLRADRSNSEYPTAVLDACRSGTMTALVEQLAG
ncbi:TPA: hypothetical protein ACQ5TD_004872 [Klebsiella pneumoniae]|uniref:hypothetical protein n=1 Tax=Escherichia coli TaxID=562 RepID=UPI003075B22D